MNTGIRSERNSNTIQSAYSSIIVNCKVCKGKGFDAEEIIKDSSNMPESADWARQEEIRIRNNMRNSAERVKRLGENPLNPSYTLCRCRKSFEHVKELIQGDVPVELQKVRLKDIHPREITVVDVQKMAVDMFVKAYLERFQQAAKNAIGINMFGGYNRGKTFITHLLSSEVARKRYSIHHIPFFKLIKLMQSYDEVDLLREILSVDYLTIDDIGNEHQAKRGYCGELAYLLGQRTVKKKITNFVFNEIDHKDSKANINATYGSAFYTACSERNMSVSLPSLGHVLNRSSHKKFFKQLLKES